MDDQSEAEGLWILWNTYRWSMFLHTSFYPPAVAPGPILHLEPRWWNEVELQVQPVQKPSLLLSLRPVWGHTATLRASRSCSRSAALLPPDHPRFQPRHRSPSTHPSRTEIQTLIPDRMAHLPPSIPPPLFFSASPLFSSLHLFPLPEFIRHTRRPQGCSDQQSHE